MRYERRERGFIGRHRTFFLALAAAACGTSGPTNATVTVSVRLDGGGTATVTSDPAGISCTGWTCTGTFSAGTAVTLTAAPGTARFVRWGGACSGSATTCDLTVSADTSALAVFLGANYVFATSTDIAPVGLTLAGADDECTALAAYAGLPGTYVAWLSTSTVDAASRLGTARGWVRTDGLPFADTASALTESNAVLYPPRLDEWGRVLSRTEVLTGTEASGRLRAGFNCDDWTNTNGALLFGNATAGPGMWTEAGGTVCGSGIRGHLYCFGIDAAQPLAPTSAAGRIAFLSQPTTLGGGGVDVLDALCAAEAAAASLGGTFKALVATSTASALSRFNLAGATWVRPDGVPVVSTAADLASKDLVAPIAVGSDGVHRVDFRVWTGAKSPTSIGTAETTCANWTDASVTSSGVVGFPDETEGPSPSYKTATGFFSVETTSCAGGALICDFTMTCDSAAPVYCLEQ